MKKKLVKLEWWSHRLIGYNYRASCMTSKSVRSKR